MEKDLNRFLGKNFLVYGLGISGLSAIKFLANLGFKVIATDDNLAAIEKTKEKLKDDKNFDLISFKQPSEISFDSNSKIIFAPGIPLYFPSRHKILEIIAKTNAELICDIELLYQAFSGKDSRFIAITGTNGKSTTTALTGFIFEKLGFNSAIGGNIGLACLEMPDVIAKKATQSQLKDDSNSSDSFFILETSSFQLDLIAQSRFNVAALLNITPDHIDRHGSMANYIAAKKRIFLNQKAGDSAIIDVDNKNSRKVFEELQADKNFEAELIGVSTRNIPNQGLAIIDGKFHANLWGQKMQCDLRSQYLLGKHNDQNMAFSLAIIISALKQNGELVENIFKNWMPKIIDCIKQFKGLAHRIQILGKKNDINFINDSKATNAESTANALQIFENIFWILGGKAKEGGISELASFFPKIHKAYLIGEASADFAKILAANSVKFELCGDLKNAFKAAFNDAKANSLGNKNILLSPACASFDQWKNFEERGEAFCKMFDELST